MANDGLRLLPGDVIVLTLTLLLCITGAFVGLGTGCCCKAGLRRCVLCDPEDDLDRPARAPRHRNGRAVSPDNATRKSIFPIRWRDSALCHHPGWPFDDQVLCLIDPGPAIHCLEQATIEATGGPVIDILDRSLVAQPGIVQSRPQSPFIALVALRFMVEQEPEPFGMRELEAPRVDLQLGEGARHPGKPELVHLVESRMGQVRSPQ